MKNTCCDDFKYISSRKKFESPNIRIVKFTSEFLINQGGAFVNRDNKQLAINRARNDVKFFITQGYEKFSLSSPQLNINFCPYCGQNLHMYYTEDTYMHEIEGITFKL